jgi:glutamine amidotransferase
VTCDPHIISSADKVILPGVGDAKNTMRYLLKNNLDLLIKNLKQDVLGICLGMQILCKHSEEGDSPCLNIIDLDIKRFISVDNSFKIPNIGWGKIEKLNSKLFHLIPDGSYMYFIHSYFASICSDISTSISSHAVEYSASIQFKNYYGLQFHPEKSGYLGEQVLKNFLEL